MASDTPESDVFKLVVTGDAWLCMTGLERRAQEAEKKLKIANDIIKAAIMASKKQGFVQFARQMELMIKETE